MRLGTVRFGLWQGVAALAVLAGVAWPAASFAQSSPPIVTVWITDQGYQPQNLMIPPNTFVRWVNLGNAVHTATSDTPLFDSGGLANTSIGGVPSNSYSYLFTGPTNLTYHSETDVLYVVNQHVDASTGRNSPSTDRFWQMYGSINVVPGAPLPASIPAPSLAPPAQATAVPGPQPISVTITDNGFQPPTIRVPAGGSVIFTNNGNLVHTATSDVQAWDTGGLGSGQFITVNFAGPGVYPFHSEPDKQLGKPLIGMLVVYALGGVSTPTPEPTVTAGLRDPNFGNPRQ